MREEDLLPNKIQPVEGLGDPRLADFANLRDPELLSDHGIFIAESRLVVRTLLLDSQFHARSLLLTQAALDRLGDLIDAVPDDSPIFLANRKAIDDVVGFHIHQGCLAVGERKPVGGLDGLLEQPLPETLLLLENISNPDNVGALFRNAVAYRVGAVLLDERCSDPLYRKAIRSSIGATLRVPFFNASARAADQARLRQVGYELAALTPSTDAIDLREFCATRDPTRKIAWLLGNEGLGLSSEAIASAEVQIRIPISSSVDSLNVATAAAIALYEMQCRHVCG